MDWSPLLPQSQAPEELQPREWSWESVVMWPPSGADENECVGLGRLDCMNADVARNDRVFQPGWVKMGVGGEFPKLLMLMWYYSLSFYYFLLKISFFGDVKVNASSMLVDPETGVPPHKGLRTLFLSQDSDHDTKGPFKETMFVFLYQRWSERLELLFKLHDFF